MLASKTCNEHISDLHVQPLTTELDTGQWQQPTTKTVLHQYWTSSHALWLLSYTKHTISMYFGMVGAADARTRLL